MPDLTGMEPQDPSPLDLPEPEPLEFTVLSQTLELEIDFRTRSAKGTAVFEIQPWANDLQLISMNARQCNIDVANVTVDNKSCKVDWEDQYKRIAVPEYVDWTANNWCTQQEKIEALAKNAEEPELTIHLPQGFVIREEPLGAVSNMGADIDAALAANSASAPNSDTQYLPIRVSVPFSTTNFRDGLHFAGLDDTECLYRQYPHMYTKQSSTGSGISQCIFPCFDNIKVKPLWKISIRCGRTLGDALIKQPTPNAMNGRGIHGANSIPNGSNGTSVERAAEINDFGLDEEDKLREMFVVCAGDFIKDEIDPADTSKKIVTYELAGNMVYAGHIGFSIGPFEYVDLSSVEQGHRPEEENVKLGQTAVKVNGWCLPGRGAEVHTAALPLAKAVDHFCITYGAYPFKQYTVCFVGDQIQDTVDTASMTLCSDRLLFSEDMIDPVIPVARKLVHALARQYMGVSILPGKPKDTWAVVGIAHFLKDSYMKELGGVNEFHFNLKQRADRVMELDVRRPSLYDLGATLNLGPFELEFMELKAPLVLHMLDRRISKDPNHAITGLNRIISKIFTMVNTGGSTDDSRTLTTAGFERTCDKFFKNTKLKDFFRQWVYHSGYPSFVIRHKFDKKNMKIKLTVKQIQNPGLGVEQHTLNKSEFAREYKEHVNEVYASDVSNYFTGSMSVRVHEADGTPYEHTFTIDAKEKTIDIPYNTKYKRAQKVRKLREREAASKGDSNIDGVDTGLYRLGDVLDTAEEEKEWAIENWDGQVAQSIDEAPFEWISIDADHEWRISEIDYEMDPWQWEIQLQQDRDVVAHVNAIKALAKSKPSFVVASILARTVMDKRYFHGVRTLAVESLPAQATPEILFRGKWYLEKIFTTLFCYENTLCTPRPNKFESWETYFVQCALVKTMPKIRSSDGTCSLDTQQFLLDQLKLNDNSENDFSDCQYVGTLVEAMTDAMIQKKPSEGVIPVMGEMDEAEADELRDFQQKAIEEIDRHLKNDMTIGSDDNIFTQKCLQSKLRLMQAGILDLNPAEFLAYVHPDTLDLVQIKAMSAAVDLGVLSKSDGVIQLMLHIMSTNGSPYLRDQFFKIFWEGLASIAFGEHDEKPPAAANSAPGQEPSGAAAAPAAQGQEQPEAPIELVQGQVEIDARARRIARTTNVDAAVAALKEELSQRPVLKQALWEAVKSPRITLGEQATLLEFCKMLYEGTHSFPIKLRYPRYFAVRNLGKGVLGFRRSEKLRAKIVDKNTFIERPAVPAVVKRIKVTNHGGDMRAPPKPSVPKVVPPLPKVAPPLPRVVPPPIKNLIAASSNRNPPLTTAKSGESTASLNLSSSSQVSMAPLTAVPSVLKGKPSRIVKLKVKNKNFLRALSKSAAPSKAVAPSKPAGFRLKLNHMAKTSAPSSVNSKSSPLPDANQVTPTPSGAKPIPAVNRTPLPDGKGERKPLPDGRQPLPNSRPAKRPLANDNQEEDSHRPRKIIKLKIGKPAPKG